MGKTQSKRVRSVTDEEIYAAIGKDDKERLNRIFSQYKNNSGFISEVELFKVLDSILLPETYKLLYQIIPMNSKKLGYIDLLYLYLVLIKASNPIKISFVLDFLFVNQEKIACQLFEKAVNELFNNDQIANQPLANELLKLIKTSKPTNMISRETVRLSLIENKVIKDFELYSATSNKVLTNEISPYLSINNDKDQNKDGNKANISGRSIYQNQEELIKDFYCRCKSEVKIQKYLTKSFGPSNQSKFLQMKTKFTTYERENKGFFSLSIYENMLNQIKVHEKITSSILAYIKHKTQKSFISFDHLKWLCEMIDADNEADIIEFLYQVVSLHNLDVSKRSLYNFVKAFDNLKSSDVDSILNEAAINTEKISFDVFKKIMQNYGNFIMEQIEKIKYIPYIFFDIPCEDKIKQKNCIKILMGTNSEADTLKEYVQDELQRTKLFYLVNQGFWAKWCHYVGWLCTNGKSLDPGDCKDKEKDANIDDDDCASKHDIKKKEGKFPKIENSIIAINQTGKLKQNLTYLKDYVIMPEVMYRLFEKWYGSNKLSVCREVIPVSSTFLLDSGLAVKRSTGKQPFAEVEIYPIFISYLKLSNLLNNIDKTNDKTKNLSKIKELLSDWIKENSHKLTQISRLTLISDIKKKFEQQINLVGKIRIWTYYNSNFYIPKENKTLEEENFEDDLIIVFEEQINGEWETEINLDTKKLKDEQRESMTELAKSIMVGLKNLGNSKSIIFKS